MLKKYLTICLLSLLIVSGNAYSATGPEKPWRRFDNNNGLAANYVLKICQDSFSYIWILTRKGVQFYDGLKWSANFSLEKNKHEILDMTVTGKGQIIVKTKSGRCFKIKRWPALEFKDFPSQKNLDFSKFDATKKAFPDEVYDPDTGKPLHINVKFIDDEDNYWAGCGSFGLYFQNRYGWQTIPFKAGNTRLSGLTIYDLVAVNASKLYAATDKGIFQLKGDYFLKLDLKPKTTASFYKLKAVGEDVLWAANKHGGLSKINASKFISKVKIEKLINRTKYNVAEILTDNRNSLWIITRNNGIFYKTGGTWRQVPVEGASAVKFTCGTFDHNNQLWCGTKTNGIIYYSQRGKQWIQPNKFNNYQIISAYCDLSGVLWFVSLGKGLIRHDPTKENWQQFNVSNTNGVLKSDVITCISQDRPGNYYFGFKNGLIITDITQARSSMRKWKPEEVSDLSGALNQISIVKTLHTDDGRLWVAANNKIAVIQKDAVKKPAQVVSIQVTDYDGERKPFYANNGKLQLPSNTREIDILLRTVSFSFSPDDYHYYYKINNQNWQHSKDGKVRISAVTPGETYNFHYRSLNKFRQPGEAKTISFQIDSLKIPQIIFKSFKVDKIVYQELPKLLAYNTQKILINYGVRNPIPTGSKIYYSRTVIVNQDTVPITKTPDEWLLLENELKPAADYELNIKTIDPIRMPQPQVVEFSLGKPPPPGPAEISIINDRQKDTLRVEFAKLIFTVGSNIFYDCLNGSGDDSLEVAFVLADESSFLSRLWKRLSGKQGALDELPDQKHALPLTTLHPIHLNYGETRISFRLIDHYGQRSPQSQRVILRREIPVYYWFLLFFSIMLLLIRPVYVFIKRTKKKSEIAEIAIEGRERLNPYNPGQPVKKSARFFGRQALLDELLQIAPEQHLLLSGESRIGKTSILYQLKNYLDDSTDSNYKFYTAFIDLQIIDPEEFLAGMMETLVNELSSYGQSELQLRISTAIETEQQAKYSVTDFIEDLKNIMETLLQYQSRAIRLILFIDEINFMKNYSVRYQNDFRRIFTEDFKRQLIGVMAGIDLESEYEKPGSYLDFLRLFTVGVFTKAEAIKLIREPVKKHITYDDAAIEKILAYSNCRPYAIQHYGYHLFNRVMKTESLHIGTSDVEQLKEQVDAQVKFAISKKQPNPDIIDKPVSDESKFFGREKDIKELATHIHNNISVLLQGPDGIGKSSILWQLKRRFENQDDEAFQYYTIYLSLKGVSHEHFFSTIIRKLEADFLKYIRQPSLSLRLDSKANSRGYSYSAFRYDLESIMNRLSRKTQQTTKLILFIDDVDVLNHYEMKYQANFRNVLTWGTENNIIFTMAGVQLETEWNEVISNWYNTMLLYQVKPLAPEAAARMLCEPIRDLNLNYRQETIDAILNFSDGHPAKIQYFRREIFNQAQKEEKDVITLAEVESMMKNLIF